MTVVKEILIVVLHYLFWMILLTGLWIYLFIWTPQSGSMFRYVGF